MLTFCNQQFQLQFTMLKTSVHSILCNQLHSYHRTVLLKLKKKLKNCNQLTGRIFDAESSAELRMVPTSSWQGSLTSSSETVSSSMSSTALKYSSQTSGCSSRAFFINDSSALLRTSELRWQHKQTVNFTDNNFNFYTCKLLVVW